MLKQMCLSYPQNLGSFKGETRYTMWLRGCSEFESFKKIISIQSILLDRDIDGALCSACRECSDAQGVITVDVIKDSVAETYFI